MKIQGGGKIYGGGRKKERALEEKNFLSGNEGRTSRRKKEEGNGLYLGGGGTELHCQERTVLLPGKSTFLTPQKKGKKEG